MPATTPLSFIERDFLRTRMMYPKTINSNPEFESSMDAINGITDGDATITALRTTIALMQAFEVKLNANYTKMLTSEVVGEVKINAVAQDYYWRWVTGPAFVTDLETHLSMKAAGNYYAPQKPNTRAGRVNRRTGSINFNPNQRFFRGR